MRLGLCCIFREAPIKFRTTTATAIKKLARNEGRKKLADLCATNAAALMEALQFCSANGIGCFRVNSQILPLKTHPDVGYNVRELPGGRQIIEQFRACGKFAEKAGLRTTFHPDQFVVLNRRSRMSSRSRSRKLNIRQKSPSGSGPMSSLSMPVGPTAIRRRP